jgi:hypothetical protein
MKRLSLSAMIGSLLVPFVAAAMTVPAAALRATVLIANYDDGGEFVGWGSGFFVDEGIVITNKHVIQGGDWYRVYATGADNRVNFDCFRKITRSDVKINLDDDVAYIRVYLPCEHGIMKFTADPLHGDPIAIVGYPYKGLETIELTISSGSVIGQTEEGWLVTDAHMDVGNSGGPVLHEGDIAGVAVAKGIDDEGNYLEGYFIPSSVIIKGLLYANDSGFGYTPQSSISSRSSSSRSSLSSRFSSSASSQRFSFSSVSSRSSVSGLQMRTCLRAEKYRQYPGVFRRLNQRLMNRYGFTCQ